MAYDNTLRTASARATRARVLDAARAAFLERGFAGTTVKHVAQSAGVSPETIYKTFGGKAGLLKDVYDTALVGDDEEVPLAQRPEALAVFRAPDARSAVAAYAVLAQLIAGRVDPLLRVLLGSRDTDTALASFARTIDRERWTGSSIWVGHWHAAGWLREDLTVERAADILCALNSNEPRWLLQDRGWTTEEITSWLTDTLCHALLR
ncbi:TetR/AcrR family transcriptional regulator [Nocardia thailandica]